MKKSDLILPIIASIGVGAVTFFTMSKNNNSVSKTMENVAPMISNLSSESSEQQDENNHNSLGPHGMS